MQDYKQATIQQALETALKKTPNPEEQLRQVARYLFQLVPRHLHEELIRAAG